MRTLTYYLNMLSTIEHLQGTLRFPGFGAQRWGSNCSREGPLGTGRSFDEIQLPKMGGQGADALGQGVVMEIGHVAEACG